MSLPSREATFATSWQNLERLSPLELAFNIISDLEIDPTLPKLEVSITCWGMQISLPYKSFPAETLRRLKKEVKLEVPSYMHEGYSFKDLQGILQITRNERNYDIDFRLGHAFTCTPTFHTREVEPSEFARREARALKVMTSEQALAHIQAQVEALLKPRRVAVYDCMPSVPETPKA